MVTSDKVEKTNQPQIGGLGTELADTAEPLRTVRRRLLLWPLAGVAFLVYDLVRYQPLDDKLLYWINAVPCFVIASLIIIDVWRSVKSRTNVRPYSPRTFWLAIVCLGFPAIVLVNGALDHSPVEKHRQTVRRTILEHESRNQTSYYVECSSWRGRSHEKLMVSSRDYLTYRPGDPIIVETHRGALGIPRLVSVHAPE